MPDRHYWSARQGRGPRANPTTHDIYRVLVIAVEELERLDYFQEWFGKDCVDAGWMPGRAGSDANAHIEATLGYRHAWPLSGYDPWEGIAESRVADAAIQDIEETFRDRTFDLIEYIHDHVSKGIEGDDASYHSYADCGWHFERFAAAPAQQHFRKRINSVLGNYGGGYQLSQTGELQHTAPEGLEDLIEAPVLSQDQEIRDRVAAAVRVYRSRNRTADDQREAVRNLFDVLERLRPMVKEEMLNSDERDLFAMANGFNIRHMDARQRTHYDGPLWLSWMFYVGLATIHLITRISHRDEH